MRRRRRNFSKRRKPSMKPRARKKRFYKISRGGTRM